MSERTVLRLVVGAMSVTLIVIGTALARADNGWPIIVFFGACGVLVPLLGDVANE